MSASGKRSILIEVLGEFGKFTAGSKKAEKGVAAFEDRLQAAGRALAGAYIAKKVVDFASAAVKAAGDDARAQLRLATAMRNTVAATDAQIAATEKWISKTEVAKAFIDDDLRESMAVLVRVTKDVTQSQELLEMAMDISRGTGRELSEVSAAVAKAYAGQTTALTRMIPGVRQAGEKTVDFATAQQRLNTMFSGQAAAYMEGYAGKAERLSIQWNNMKEQIGYELMPAFTFLAGAVSGLFSWFNDLDEGAQRVIITAVLLGGGLIALGSTVTALRGAVTALGISASAANVMLLGMAVAIGAVAAAAYVFGGGLDETGKVAAKLELGLRSASSQIDLQRIAFLDAAGAAREYGAVLRDQADEVIRELIRGNKDLSAGMKLAGISMEDMVAASRDDAKMKQLQAKVTKAAADANLDLSGKLKNLTPAQEKQISQLKVVNLHLGRNADATDRATEALVENARLGDVQAIVALKASDAWNRLTEAEQAAAEATLDAAAAAEKAKPAVAGLGGAAGELGEEADGAAGAVGRLERSSERARAAAEAQERAWRNLSDALSDELSFLDLADQFDAVAAAGAEFWEKSAKGGPEAEKALRDYERSVLRLKQQIVDYGKEIAELPPERVTELHAMIDRGEFAAVEAELARLERARTVELSFNLKGLGDVKLELGRLGGPTPRARGGRVVPGRDYLIGEYGWEVVRFDQPGRVLSHDDSRRELAGVGAGAGRGDFTQHVHLHGSRATAQEVAREATWAWRVN